MLYYIPFSVVALYMTGTWAAAENDINGAYEELANSPLKDCGDIFTRYPYEISGMTTPTVPQIGKTLLYVVIF